MCLPVGAIKFLNTHIAVVARSYPCEYREREPEGDFIIVELRGWSRRGATLSRSRHRSLLYSLSLENFYARFTTVLIGELFFHRHPIFVLSACEKTAF